MNGEERRTETVVRDIPAELWIKVIAFFAACTLLVAGIAIALGGYIGIRIADKLDALNDTVVEAVGIVQVNSSEISTLKANGVKIDVKVEGINTRVFKLEGYK